LKMKMAIIFGVSHMLVGICLKGLNFIYFKKYAYLFMEVLPEFLILGCTFGYLGFMIVYKWCINWSNVNSQQPPVLLTTMTDFFLHPTTPTSPPLYNGQIPVQLTLFIIAVVAIPVLLIPTPIYKIIEHLIKKKRGQPNVTSSKDIQYSKVDQHPPSTEPSTKVQEIKIEKYLEHDTATTTTTTEQQPPVKKRIKKKKKVLTDTKRNLIIKK